MDEFKCTKIFDFKPSYENRLTVFAFQPSRALKVQVASTESVMLTREEAEGLIKTLALWLVTNG